VIFKNGEAHCFGKAYLKRQLHLKTAGKHSLYGEIHMHMNPKEHNREIEECSVEVVLNGKSTTDKIDCDPQMKQEIKLETLIEYPFYKVKFIDNEVTTTTTTTTTTMTITTTTTMTITTTIDDN